MELAAFFRSVLEQDTAAIVLCDLNHTILYMNPAALTRYHRDLRGQSLLDCHNAVSKERIKAVLAWFAADKSHNRVYIAHDAKENKDNYMIALRDETNALIGYYEKHEYRASEALPLYQMD